jgi:hypothetical protein
VLHTFGRRLGRTYSYIENGQLSFSADVLVVDTEKHASIWTKEALAKFLEGEMRV